MGREEGVTKIARRASPKKVRAFPTERWSSLRLPLRAPLPSSRNGGCGRRGDERGGWEAMPQALARRIPHAFVSRTPDPTRPELPLAGWPGRTISAYGIGSRRAAEEFSYRLKGNSPIWQESLPRLPALPDIGDRAMLDLRAHRRRHPQREPHGNAKRFCGRSVR